MTMHVDMQASPVPAPGGSGNSDLLSEILFTTPQDRRVTLRYGVALGVTIAAFSMRYLVHPDLLHRLPFVFFVPATLIAAWYGGLGPGVVAMLAGLLLGDYFFLEPHHALGPLSPAARMAVAGYALSGIVGIALFQISHATHRRLLRRGGAGGAPPTDSA